MPTLFRKRPTSAVVVRPRAMAAALPAARPVTSEIAAMLRDRGTLVCTGTVTGWNETPGQAYVPIQISSAALAAPTQTTGMANITLNVDGEAARYLAPRTRVRIAVQVLTEDEDD